MNADAWCLRHNTFAVACCGGEEKRGGGFGEVTPAAPSELDCWANASNGHRS